MYSRNTFGSYYPVDSVIHRLNPIVKLINFLIMFLLLILTNMKEIHIFLLLFILVIVLLSYVPFIYYFNTFYSLRYIYLILALICAFNGVTLGNYFIYASKLVIFVLYLNVLAYTTSPSESIYSIEKFLNLFNFLYLKVGGFASKINSLLRRYSLYITVKTKTVRAASSRGITLNRFNIINKIKMHNRIRKLTKLKSKEIRESMELRLYDVRKKRTKYRPIKVGLFDIFFLLFHVSLIVVFMVSEGLI